jgi:3-dehydroquinate synthase
MIFDVGGEKINVMIGENILNLFDKGKKYFVIYQNSLSNELDKVSSNLMDYDIYEAPDGEKAKDVDVALDIIKKMVEKGYTRRDAIISLGGGTISDLSGFVASIYMRGINLINIPTTLLSMVDASIGGKNGVNFRGIKNVIGTFYQPRMIINDILFLKTLPKEEILNGMGEVIKYSIIMDKDLYNYIVNNKEEILNLNKDNLIFVIESSIKDKMKIVVNDVKETNGLRAVLNFGHTIGHAIESGSEFKIKHGFAISYGMACETQIGINEGIINEDIYYAIKNVLSLYKIEVKLNDIDINKALESIEKDKKRLNNKKIMIPLPISLGEFKIFTMNLDVIKKGFLKCLN